MLVLGSIFPWKSVELHPLLEHPLISKCAMHICEIEWFTVTKDLASFGVHTGRWRLLQGLTPASARTWPSRQPQSKCPVIPRKKPQKQRARVTEAVRVTKPFELCVVDDVNRPLSGGSTSRCKHGPSCKFSHSCDCLPDLQEFPNIPPWVDPSSVGG